MKTKTTLFFIYIFILKSLRASQRAEVDPMELRLESP